MPSSKKKTGAIRKKTTASELEKSKLHDWTKILNSKDSNTTVLGSTSTPPKNPNSERQSFEIPAFSSESGGQQSNQNPDNLSSAQQNSLDKTLNLYLLNLLLKSEFNLSKQQLFQLPKMVKERTNSTNSGIFVNSVSLEDVAAQSERSDRAQSITSIHSAMETHGSESHGTPTPSYEDLHARLEASNRNIDNIRNQQQHLLRLQETAKKHLEEMDKVRNQAKTNGVSTTTAPIYESVEEVHNDMSSLVDRMKNLTTFIHGQHELSALLGDDGDEEEMKEQEKLLEKLNALRSHRDEMKNLITELNNVNKAASSSVEPTPSAPEPISITVPTTVVEYERVVPIQLVGPGKKQQNNAQPSTSTPITKPTANPEQITKAEEEIAATNDLIKQKMTDISSMKNQLKYLKDMMETIKIIEAKTEGSVKDIGVEKQNSREESPLRRSESTETVVSADVEGNDEQRISNKVRLLTEVTNELRQQSMTLTNERDRIKGLKEEIMRRKNEQEAQSKINKETELLRAEYEEQKKEFEKIVRRLNSQDDENATLRNDSDGENDIPNQNIGKESIDSGAADVNNQTSASLDATASFKSGSSRSYSMPPPMIPLNTTRDSQRRFRKQSGMDNLSNYEGYVGNAGHQTLSSAPSTGPCYLYNTPYSPQFLGNNIGNTSASGEIPGFNFALLNEQAQGSTNISLQQLYQTQQLLINSITQCNNMIWQQQKEINQLNNVIISLQERLLIATEKSSFNRSESVPPHFNAIRSQSEQPLNNYFQQQSLSRHYQLQQNRRSTCNQQQNVINHHISMAENSSEYDLEPHYQHFNNQTHLNNDIPINMQQQQQHQPQTQQQQHTPIFMNHHNNNIGATNSSNNHNNQLHANNISNLLAQQQQHQLNLMRLNNVNNSASNQASSQCNQASTANASPSALNNQIVPGNRANNYLDNFRSYSRQNLLSSKSNEEQYHQSPPQQQQLLLRNQNPFNTQRNNIQPPTLPPRNSRPPTFRNPKVNRNQLTTTPISLTSILQPAPENEVSSDFVAHARNMNFTFASNDQNKVPVKATYSMTNQSTDFPGDSRYNDCERDASQYLVEGAVGGIDPEEMRRNLLVNAMKNDKFSTKFFESLKEDVYRQAYHLIKNQEQSGYGNEMVPHLTTQATNTNIDPLHEIFLNAINILSKNNNQKNEQNVESENMFVRQADFEEESPINVLNYSNELCNNSNNYNHMKDDKKQPCKLPLEPLRNFQEKNLHGISEAASSSSMISVSNEFYEDPNPIIDLIIIRVKEQYNSYEMFDDKTLLEISKLISGIIDRFRNENSIYKILTPKQIYTQMKKSDFVKRKDSFFSWLRNYLNSLFKNNENNQQINQSTSPNNDIGNNVELPSLLGAQHSTLNADLAESEQCYSLVSERPNKEVTHFNDDFFDNDGLCAGGESLLENDVLVESKMLPAAKDTSRNSNYLSMESSEDNQEILQYFEKDNNFTNNSKDDNDLFDQIIGGEVRLEDDLEEDENNTPQI